MSGRQLIDTLRELNFPDVGTLDPDSLDWMFENEAIVPLMEWFCNNVTKSNILQKSERSEYESLNESGDIVLKGRQLEDALSNLDFVQDDSLSEESLKEEVALLENNLQHHKKQKQNLDRRRKLLNNHHTSVSHRLSKMTGIESRVKQDYKNSLAQTHADDAKMNESLDKLTDSVTELSNLYKTSTATDQSRTLQTSFTAGPGQSCFPSSAGSPSMFLSQVPVQQYYNAEEGFTTQMTAYTKKQFFQGITEMVSCGGDSRYEILEISDPDSLLVRGESDHVNLQDCKDLARLQKLYVKSETERITALCDMKRLNGQSECAKEILDTLKSGTFCTEGLKNKECLEKLKASIVAIHREFTSLSEKEVPSLIQECREAKVLRVLTGDYNLKLARQEYFTSNQDKVINELILQRSRNEFLTMALEVELRQHREIHHILTSLDNQLNNQYVQWQSRMSVMSDSSLTPARHKRETIDSRDKSAARLYHMLDDGDDSTEKQLFLTYASLVANAEKLHKRHAGVQRAVEGTSSGCLTDVQQLEKCVSTCEALMYAESSTTCGQPPLTPRPLRENIIQLQGLLTRLEQGIMDVVKGVDHKKKMLKNDPLLEKKRKLYKYFFTNPNKLHQSLHDISCRLQAETHIDKAPES